MDERAISLVLTSLTKLVQITEQVDATFNARPLETCPDVYRMFATDMEPEEGRLVRTLMLVSVRRRSR
jgi:hypothetical protein